MTRLMTMALVVLACGWCGVAVAQQATDQAASVYGFQPRSATMPSESGTTELKIRDEGQKKPVLTAQANNGHHTPTATTPSAAGAKAGQSPQMWLYEQYMEQYKDPAVAVRKKAEYRESQRQHRIAARKWYGMSNSRPMAGTDPYNGTYSPYWSSSNGLFPYRWSGGGATAVYIMPGGGIWR